MNNRISRDTSKASGSSRFRCEAWTTVFAMVLGLGPITFLGGCLGGSDGVENPKLEMDFKAEDGSFPAAGRVSLYGKNLNPVTDSTPILVKVFSGKAQVSFTPEEIDGAIRTRLSLNSTALKDTLLEFNVVAVSGDREVFVEGFKYRRQGSRVGFARVVGNSETAFGPLHDTFGLPNAIHNFSGRIGMQGSVLGIDYIFILGSPYHSRIRGDSSFTLARMSAGTYGLVGADQDSSKYFASSDSLSTADTAYSAKAWDVITFVP